jgi:hypothetical protein
MWTIDTTPYPNWIQSWVDEASSYMRKRKRTKEHSEERKQEKLCIESEIDEEGRSWVVINRSFDEMEWYEACSSFYAGGFWFR